MRTIRSFTTFVMLAGAALVTAPSLTATAADEAAAAPEITITVVNLEYEGTKVWVPGSIVVKKGTKVTLKLINNVPPAGSQHGFAIPAYEVAAVVTAGTPETVTFMADRDGIFPLFCQMHPAHVGGQLVVLP
jgi:nitrosocyanin